MSALPALATPPSPPASTTTLTFFTAVFGPRPGLTPEQAQQAMHLWWRLWQERGPVTGVQRRLRMAGIMSAVKRGVIGNAAWGRRAKAMRAYYASRRAVQRRRLEAQGWSPEAAAVEADRLIRDQRAQKAAQRKAAEKAARSGTRCPTCGQRVDGL